MIVLLKKKWKNPNGKEIPVGRKIEVINEVGNTLIKKGIADFVSGDTRATLIKPIKKEKVEDVKKEDDIKDEKSNKNK
jgi:hypothetical protein